MKISLTAIIGAIYVSLTVALGSLSYSWIQVRISEALTPLPFLIGLPAVVGLTLGCCTANLFSPVGIPDLVFGPILTLTAALLSWKFSFNRKAVACTYPVLINAFGVSCYISLYYNVPYWTSVLTIGLGEFIASVLVGYPLLLAIERMRIAERRES